MHNIQNKTSRTGRWSARKLITNDSHREISINHNVYNYYSASEFTPPAPYSSAHAVMLDYIATHTHSENGINFPCMKIIILLILLLLSFENDAVSPFVQAKLKIHASSPLQQYSAHAVMLENIATHTVQMAQRHLNFP